MGKFPDWRATHHIVSAKGSLSVMRLFECVDGDYREVPDKRGMPYWFKEDWTKTKPGLGRKTEPIEGSAIKLIQTLPKVELKPGQKPHEIHALNKLAKEKATYTAAMPEQVESHGSAIGANPAVLSELPLAGGKRVVTLSSNAAACVYGAASFPEWTCSHDNAFSSTGDNARVMEWDKERNVKKVQVYNIDPATHKGELLHVLVREHVVCELW